MKSERLLTNKHIKGEERVLKYNKSYIIFVARPGHYRYNFQEQFIT